MENLSVLKVTKGTKKSSGHERWRASDICKLLDDADLNLANSTGADS